MKQLSVDLRVTATVPDDFNIHDLADIVKWHLNLTDLDMLEVDVSAVKITDMKEQS